MRGQRHIGFGPRVVSEWSGEADSQRVEIWWVGLRIFYVGMHLWGRGAGMSVHPLPGLRIDINFGKPYVPSPLIDPWSGEPMTDQFGNRV